MRRFTQSLKLQDRTKFGQESSLLFVVIRYIGCELIFFKWKCRFSDANELFL